MGKIGIATGNGNAFAISWFHLLAALALVFAAGWQFRTKVGA